MTLEEAKNLRHGDIVYEGGCCNKAGEPRRWRVTGKVKTWKRDPSRISIPVRHGLYTNGYIDRSNLNLLELTEEAAMLSASYAGAR